MNAQRDSKKDGKITRPGYVYFLENLRGGIKNKPGSFAATLKL
jgi:hypothetical protein